MTSRSIEECQPKHKHNHLKTLRNKQSNKPDKNIVIAKNFSAFTTKAKFDPYKYTFFKNMSKTNFCF